MSAAPDMQHDMPLAMQRSHGRAAVAFKRRGPATVLDRLHQEGCAKLRFPKARDLGCAEAVLLNTAGGLTGGDSFSARATWGEGTTATVTGQAAERIYRSSGGEAQVEMRLDVATGAFAEWLPQETILFDRARIRRRLDAEIAEGGRAILVEPLVLGRALMGETVRQASLIDRWRIRHAGRLVLADGLRLTGDLATVCAGPAVTGGCHALATLVYVGADAGEHLSAVRGCLGDSAAGASLIGRVLVVRLVAEDAERLRRALARIVTCLRSRAAGLPARMPQAWQSWEASP